MECRPFINQFEIVGREESFFGNLKEMLTEDVPPLKVVPRRDFTRSVTLKQIKGGYECPFKVLNMCGDRLCRPENVDTSLVQGPYDHSVGGDVFFED